MIISEGEGQLTLVAFLDRNDTEFWRLIDDLQSRLSTLLGAGVFTPYSSDQLHGTLIGLEGDRTDAGIISRYGHIKPDDRKSIDFESIIDFLLGPNRLLPFNLAIGGFKEANQYSFTSRGEHPYYRSFSIQNGDAVVIGWPQRERRFTSSVNDLRRSLNRFSAYHKYHESKTAYDNDFYMVIGKMTKPPNKATAADCESEIRKMISMRKLPPITIGREQLRLVRYSEYDVTLREAIPLTLEEARSMQ